MDDKDQIIATLLAEIAALKKEIEELKELLNRNSKILRYLPLKTSRNQTIRHNQRKVTGMVTRAFSEKWSLKKM